LFFHLLVKLIDFTKRIYRVFHPDWIDIEVMRMEDNTYVATAFDGKYGVYHNYGSTPEGAKEMALWNLKKCYEEETAHLE
jgi:3-dehydroquinate dehydratase